MQVSSENIDEETLLQEDPLLGDNEDAEELPEQTDIDTALATGLLDFTLFLSCLEMVYFAIRMRFVRREIEKNAKGEQ